MSKRREAEQDCLQRKKIEDLLKQVPSDTLAGRVIHRVLNGESEYDLNTLLRNLLSQVEVDEQAVKNLLGEKLLEEIKSYVARLPEN
jgi:hypothetical protein